MKDTHKNSGEQTAREEADLVATVAFALDEQANQISPAIQAHLQAARRKALEEINTSDCVNGRWRGLAAGVCVVAVAVIAVNIGWLGKITTGSANSTDWQMVVQNEDYELLQHDIDFYYWLEEQRDPG